MISSWLFNRKDTDNHGFTIVELMISVTIFTLILVATSAVLVQMGRSYYRSVFTSRTQSVARSVVDNVSRSVQFSGSQVISSGSSLVINSSNGISARAVCIGTTRFTYALNSVVGDDNVGQALWRDRVGSTDDCDPIDLSSLPSDNEGSELLSENMQLLWFSIEPIDGIREYRVRVDIAYGDTDQIEGVDASGGTVEDITDPSIVRYRCSPSTLTIQFCAMSSLSSTTAQRL